MTSLCLMSSSISPDQNGTWFSKASWAVILAKGGHSCLIQVGLLLFDVLLSPSSYDCSSLFVYAFSCFTASLSWLAVGKLLPIWAPCVPWSSPHTWLSCLSFWKVTGGCTLTSHPNELLNRILVRPEQKGCWTLKCSPGAGKPYKPDLSGWSDFLSWLFIYFLYYSGYAVTAGHFSQPTTTDIVGGAPQDGGIGKVWLFIRQ